MSEFSKDQKDMLLLHQIVLWEEKSGTLTLEKVGTPGFLTDVQNKPLPELFMNELIDWCLSKAFIYWFGVIGALGYYQPSGPEILVINTPLLLQGFLFDKPHLLDQVKPKGLNWVSFSSNFTAIIKTANLPFDLKCWIKTKIKMNRRQLFLIVTHI